MRIQRGFREGKNEERRGETSVRKRENRKGRRREEEGFRANFRGKREAEGSGGFREVEMGKDGMVRDDNLDTSFNS